MAEQKTLKKALRQMAEGSKSGFRTFYQGSIQYVYSSARLLYDNHEDACRFVTDVYPYLYLHLPEYEPSDDLQIWIAGIIMERYRQLTGGKRRPATSPTHSVSATPLTRAEQEHIWHLLEAQIHFPKEIKVKTKQPRRILPYVVILLLLLLLLSVLFIPGAKEKLTSLIPLHGNTGEISDSEADAADDTDDGESNDSDTDEINSLLDQLQSDNDESDTDGTDLSDTTTQSSSSTNAASADEPTIDTPSVEEPTVDTPSIEEPTVDEPTVETPSASDSSGSSSTGSQSSDTQDLENMELELYYGDSLKYADSN